MKKSHAIGDKLYFVYFYELYRAPIVGILSETTENSTEIYYRFRIPDDQDFQEIVIPASQTAPTLDTLPVTEL